MNHRFLFIHIPKTGGNSIQSALFPYSEDNKVRLEDFHDGIDRFEVRSDLVDIHKHSTLAEYRDQLDPAHFDRLFRFTCVRNPWDRCVSFYFSPHRGKVEWSPAAFAQFVSDEVQPANAFLLLDNGEKDSFDNVEACIRFENMATDFRAVCAGIGIVPPPLLHLNRSTRRDYREYYRDVRMIDRVAEKFAGEITRFGYEFDG